MSLTCDYLFQNQAETQIHRSQVRELKSFGHEPVE